MTRSNRRKFVARPRLGLEALEAREVPAAAFALGTGANANNLFRFDTATPQTLTATTAITGLAASDVLVGTDFRPSTGQLFGVAANVGANTVRVYTINPTSGVATAVGTAQNVATITGATKFGVDFNPVADRIRVTTDLASDGAAAGSNTNNFRLNPITGALVAIDADLDFTAVPGSAPEVSVAYSNSFAGASTTTLFGIVSGTDRLVINGVAGTPGAILTDVGALGVNTSTVAGLDIFGPANTAVAALTVGGVSQLYSVNTTTGAATLINTIGAGTLAIADISVFPVLAPIAAGGANNGTVQLITSVAGTASAPTTITPFLGSDSNVRSTTGDVNGDGIDDIISVTGPGTPIRFTVISGADNTTVLIPPTAPFVGSESFTGGGFVSSGDFNNDGRDEIAISPDQGGGPRITVFTLVGTTPTVVANFFGITGDPSFRGGVRTAVGDVNRDGTPDLAVAAGFLGGPRVAIFNGTTVIGATQTKLVGDFFAFPGTDSVTLRNGSFVAIGDLNGDGFGDLIFGGGPGGAPRVFALNGQLISAGSIDAAYAAPIANFFVAGNSLDRGGIRVAATDADGDNRADLVVGSGEGVAARVRIYLGANITASTEPSIFQDITVFGGAILTGGVFVG